MIVLAVMVLTLGVAVPAMSQVTPVVGNSVDVFLSVTPNTQYRDGSVAYTVAAFNAGFVEGASPAWIDVTFTPPGPDGTASGTPVVLATGLRIEVNQVITWNVTTNPELLVPLAHIEEGVGVALAKVDYYARYDATPAYYASGTKNIPVTVLEYAELGDFVWNDLDQDGIQEAGEPGIEGVTVNLWSVDELCAPVAIIDTMLTDANGYFLFDSLKAGDYKVQFVLPDGDWFFTMQYAGTDDMIDSNANPATGITDCVTLAAGASDLTIDAGMYELFEELTVDKTAVTSYVRTNEWAIDKWVETKFGHTIGEEQYPKIWLWFDGSGDECATWTVDVAYEGYTDSDWNVSGTVTIENTGDLPAMIESVEDVLGGSAIEVDFGGVIFPYELAVGDDLVGTYDVDVASAIEGVNKVTVTTERDDYMAEAAIDWGAPAEELYGEITVQDVMSLNGVPGVPVELGMLSAPNGDTFTYSECFAWADYVDPDPASWRYDNTATIIETEQSASAVLKVNWMPPAELGDFVWNDLDQDGIQDEGEPGIEGVTVNLWSVDELCAPVAIIDTMLTDANGYFLFDSLKAGDYKVQFVLPDGDWFFTMQYAGTDDTIDSNANPATGITDCVTLAAGASDLTIDAGMYQMQELCWADETAWAYGDDYAKPNWDYVNNRFWGWTNGPLSEGSYEWDLYAGAGANILSNGTVIGKVYVDYEDGCVTVTYEVDEGYAIGEAHLWVGNDVLPKVKRGRTSVYTNAPGQFPYGDSYGFDPVDSSTWESTWTWTQCGFKGDIYVAAHAVVWGQVECTDNMIE